MPFLQIARHIARLATIVAALVLGSPGAYAQKPTPAALQAAHEILTLTGATSVFNPLIGGVVEQAKLLYLQQNPGLSKDLNEIAKQIRDDLVPRMKELTDEVAKNYTSRFTDQELNELLAFYKSPIGKKLVTQQPLIAETSFKFAQTWANSLSDEVIGKMRVELKKKGHAL